MRSRGERESREGWLSSWSTSLCKCPGEGTRPAKKRLSRPHICAAFRWKMGERGFARFAGSEEPAPAAGAPGFEVGVVDGAEGAAEFGSRARGSVLGLDVEEDGVGGARGD